jgi:hypothetical protein
MITAECLVIAIAIVQIVCVTLLVIKGLCRLIVLGCIWLFEDVLHESNDASEMPRKTPRQG